MVKLHFTLSVLAMLLLVFSASIVSAAVGISPGIYNIDFSPNLRQQVSFEFLGDSDVELEIYASGELARYVTLSKKKITGNGAVDVNIRLPESIETPGVHTIYIGARPVVTEEQGFGIIGNVKGTINIIVPYPGQYALINLQATNTNAGQIVNFTTTIENLGNEAVSANGLIKVYLNSDELTEIDLGNFELKSPDRIQVFKQLDTNQYIPGTYFALAELFYGDGNIARANSSFRLGELLVRISEYTRLLERNKLNRFEITVESQWNDPIEGVYADVSLQGYPVSFKTPSAHLNGFGSTVLTGFFDTTGIESDSVTALINVHYAGKTTTENVTLTFRKKTDYLLIGLIAAAVIILGLIIFVTHILRKVSKRRK